MTLCPKRGFFPPALCDFNIRQVIFLRHKVHTFIYILVCSDFVASETFSLESCWSDTGGAVLEDSFSPWASQGTFYLLPAAAQSNPCHAVGGEKCSQERSSCYSEHRWALSPSLELGQQWPRGWAQRLCSALCPQLIPKADPSCCSLSAPGLLCFVRRWFLTRGRQREPAETTAFRWAVPVWLLPNHTAYI